MGNFIHNIEGQAYQTFSAIAGIMGHSSIDIPVLAPVVQRLDNTIHRINHYPADSVVCFVNTYPLDSDLSGG